MLERIHTKGADIQMATATNQDKCPLKLQPLEYPFDLAWERENLRKIQVQNKDSILQEFPNDAPIESLSIQKPTAIHNAKQAATD